MRAPALARAALVLLALSAASVGVLAALAPRTFYDDFPFAGHWVDRLPPYNEHLVTDVGGLYLGFAILFALAARSLRVELARAACAAWALPAFLHLVFHVGRLDGFDAADAAAQLASLAALLALPLVAWWASGPAAER